MVRERRGNGAGEGDGAAPRAHFYSGSFRDMDPGLCCAFVTPQTRRHTGQSIPGHQAGYGYLMSMNVSTAR